MRVNGKTLLAAMVPVLFAAAGYWLYRHIEVYETHTTGQFSARARRDPYLAAQRFLERSGVRVNREPLQKQIHHLAPDGVVILTTPSDTLTAPQASALLQWLYNGGNLIVVAGVNTRRDPDPLLRYFGVQRRYQSQWQIDHPGAKNEHDNGDGSDEKKLSEQLREFNREIDAGKLTKKKKKDCGCRDLASVDLRGNPRPLRIHFSPLLSLQDPDFGGKSNKVGLPHPLYWTSNEGRVHFVQFELGKGLLTVVSDLGFLTSHEIGKNDHALALLQLAGAGPVSLIGDVDMPPLISLIWRWAHEAMVAVLVVLVAGAWYRSRRFGPVRDPGTTVRRSLAEHIGASARYRWNDGQVDALLAPLREAVQRRAARAFPDYDTLDAAVRVSLLHETTGCAAGAIERALFAGAPREATAFRDAVATLQQLHQQLTSEAP